MVKFDKDKHFIEDVHADNGVLVIDTNCQGVWETGALKEMRLAFPKIYSAYKRLCFNQLLNVGSCYILEEGGYKVALLVTKKNYLNRDRDTLLSNLDKALDELFSKVPSDVWLYSPIIGRRDACGIFLLKKIRDKNVLNYNWIICTKKGSIC